MAWIGRIVSWLRGHSSPSNGLERLFSRAATDPSVRPAVYREMLIAELWVIADGPVTAGERLCTPLRPDVRLASAVMDGSDVILAFTSHSKLEQFAGDRPCVAATVMGRHLFELSKPGRGIAVNPNVGAGKLFTADEIGATLDGTLLRGASEIKVGVSRGVRVSTPVSYPTAIVSRLRAVLEHRPDVRAAYIAEVREMDGSDARLIVGVDSRGRAGEVAGASTTILAEVLGPEEYVDFLELGADPISNELRKDVPFYRKCRSTRGAEWRINVG